MKRIILLCLVIASILSPTICFSWGESKHPISELLIQRVYLDTNYVFCGCNAYWGTNVFGLFVFDRRRETWTNYPQPRRVKNIQREGDFVYITFWVGHRVEPTFRFNLQDGSFEEVARREELGIKGDTLTVDGVNCRVHRDSVIVGEAPNIKVYRPLSEPIPGPTGIQPIPKELNPIFSHPVVYQNKIYMPYDLGLGVTTSWTNGIAVFDVAERAFHFYASDILKGTVTDGFVYDSLIIFSTAGFIYEANARPAAGFVAFSPADSAFSLWKELPLPDKPLAIFQVAQDKKEYWIGTDKGVFRIDKSKNETKHYQITKGIVNKDGRNVHYPCGSSGERSSSAVAMELDKGEEVEILAVLNGWCEIKAPREITGQVDAEYVELVFREDIGKHVHKFRPLKTGETIPVTIPGGEPLILDANALKQHRYEVVGRSTRKEEVASYKIKLPTAWINMDGLVFHLGEVE